MLGTNIPNKQYLSIWDKSGSGRIKSFFELFCRRLQPTEDCLPLVVDASSYTPKTIQTWTNRLDIQVDLPLEKYYLSPSTGTYIKFLYVESGTKRKGHRPSEPATHGRGLNLIEGLAMIATWPEILEDHAIDLINSRYSIECVPTLYRWNNQTHLSAVCPDVQDAMCGAPIIKHEIKFSRQEWIALTNEHFQSQIDNLLCDRTPNHSAKKE